MMSLHRKYSGKFAVIGVTLNEMRGHRNAWLLFGKNLVRMLSRQLPPVPQIASDVLAGAP
jgi:hypothetical protein